MTPRSPTAASANYWRLDVQSPRDLNIRCRHENSSFAPRQRPSNVKRKAPTPLVVVPTAFYVLSALSFFPFGFRLQSASSVVCLVFPLYRGRRAEQADEKSPVDLAREKPGKEKRGGLGKESLSTSAVARVSARRLVCKQMLVVVVEERRWSQARLVVRFVVVCCVAVAGAAPTDGGMLRTASS